MNIELSIFCRVKNGEASPALSTYGVTRVVAMKKAGWPQVRLGSSKKGRRERTSYQITRRDPIVCSMIARQRKTTLAPMYLRLRANENHPGHERPGLVILQKYCNIADECKRMERLITVSCGQQTHSVRKRTSLSRQ